MLLFLIFFCQPSFLDLFKNCRSVFFFEKLQNYLFLFFKKKTPCFFFFLLWSVFLVSLMLFARCDMLRSSTRSRACLAMWLSGQSCARIAAWLKNSGSCSLAVTPIVTKKVRVLLPLFPTWLMSVHSWRCVLLGIVVDSSFSSPAPRPVTAHCQCSDSSLESMLVDQPQSHDVPTPGVEWSRLARCDCGLVLWWIVSAVPPVWIRCLVCATYPISHANPVARGSQWPKQLLESYPSSRSAAWWVCWHRPRMLWGSTQTGGCYSGRTCCRKY